jgi:hypothetical protein
MAIDSTPVGILAAALMDEIAIAHQDRATLRAAIVIADIGVRDDDGDSETHVVWKMASAGEGWDAKAASTAYAAGIVGQAHVALTSGSWADDDDDP